MSSTEDPAKPEVNVNNDDDGEEEEFDSEARCDNFFELQCKPHNV
jgi:hypothetical protein